LRAAVAARLAEIRERIASAARTSGRSPEEVKVVGVSKLHSPEAMAASILAGLGDIGENRVQEAAAKRPEVERLLRLNDFDGPVRWHMVGHLQSNKAARAAALFDVVQSVDSVKLARKLSRAAQDTGRQLEAMIEVNVSGESTKAGVEPEGFEELVAEVASLPGLKLAGLMTIGPLTQDRGLITAAFEKLRELRERSGVRHPDLASGWELSMGMSDDFPLAIAAGATMVRIGTAIFGPRPAVECNVSAKIHGGQIAQPN